MKKLTILAALVGLASAKAQTVTHGPFVGAVTHNSAKVWARVLDSPTVTLEYSTSPALQNPQTAVLSVSAENEQSGSAALSGLTPSTKYFYRIAGQTAIQSFKTLAAPGESGNYVITFGSCMNGPGRPYHTLNLIAQREPDLFLQCGDWGYPDTTDKVPQDTNFFSNDYQRVVDSYWWKYELEEFKNLAAKVAVDYVYDDHDYVNDNASRASSSFYDGTVFGEVPFPASARRNSIDLYTRLFPHYDLPDTASSLYHKIRFGNVEVFMCDNRSDRSPSLGCFRDSAGLWIYQNPPNHHILGQSQMNRLLNDLKNSTATWKFVMTGVSFNKGYNRAMDALSGNANQDLDLGLISNQVPPGTSVRSIMGALADTWAGYQADQERLLSHLQQNNIKNVVFLSSDSHTGAIDDGTNGGLPEIMAGSLGYNPNSRLAWIMDTVGQLPPAILGLLGLNSINLSVWNHGGNGLGNGYFGAAYGNIEVFGEDSCRLSLVDTLGGVFAELTLCKDAGNCQPVSRSGKPAPAEMFSLYPNPVEKEIRLRLDASVRLLSNSYVAVYDAVGRRVLLTEYRGQSIPLGDLPAGTYHLMLKNGPTSWVKSFQKQ